MRAHKHKERSTYASSIKALASSTQARTSLYFSKYSVLFFCVCVCVFFFFFFFFGFCAQFISCFYLSFVITFRYFVSWFWAFSFDSEIPNSKNAVTNLNCVCILIIQSTPRWRGARWLSGRVSDSGARGPGFETYRRRVVSLSKTLYSPKVLVNYPGSDGSVPTWLKNCWLGR